MKKIITLFVFFVFGAAGITFASQKVETLVSEPPQVQQATGTTDATLVPGKYPKFNTNSVEETRYHPAIDQWYVYPADTACDTYLKNTLSEAKSTVVPTYQANDDGEYWCAQGQGASDCVAAHKAGLRVVTYTGTALNSYDGSYVPIGTEGLKIEDFVIPSEYRKTAKVRLDWTIRIEGKTSFIEPLKPKLCKNWNYGTNSQTFDGGVAKTKLFVTVAGEVTGKGEEFIMQIPDAGTITKTTTAPPTEVNDPTLVGSYLITPEEFGGTLPAKMSFEVKWLNETPQELNSPASMRNLVVTLIPTTKE